MTATQPHLIDQTPEGRLADLLTECWRDRKAAVEAAPRMVRACRSLPRCPCGGADGTGCRLGHRDSRHGTRNAYIHQDCRCIPCRRANTTYIAERRAKTA